MAKKTDSSSKPAAPEKPAVAAKAPEPAPAKAPAKRKVVAKRTTKAPATKSTKPAAKAVTKRTGTTAKAPKPSVPSFTRDDIALRAYFIAEKRQANGWHGNEHQDWVEAERQLLAEAGKKQRAKKA